MASFVLSFFPLDVLDGIWDLTESVSEGFLTYTFPYRWSPADLTFNVYFYRVLYLYMTNLVIFRKNNVDKTVKQEQTAPKDESYRVYIVLKNTLIGLFMDEDLKVT